MLSFHETEATLEKKGSLPSSNENSLLELQGAV